MQISMLFNIVDYQSFFQLKFTTLRCNVYTFTYCFRSNKYPRHYLSLILIVEFIKYIDILKCWLPLEVVRMKQILKYLH